MIIDGKEYLSDEGRWKQLWCGVLVELPTQMFALLDEVNRLRTRSDRLTECDLQSIDWDERTITLRYPAGIDGLEVRAGLKIKVDLTPMQPAPETEPPVADQTSIL